MLMRVVVLVLSLIGPAMICRAESPSPGPRLVVFVVIDQFRGDFVEAYREHFVDGGFNRLIKHGAWLNHAYLQYGCTATGPGHATLATGAYPSAHGIVGNDWMLPREGGRKAYCCGDTTVQYVGLPGDAPVKSRSPRNLLVDTLGDRMKMALGEKCQVWGIALKDRAAILTGGHRADGAIWWHSASGRFVSSTYYGAGLPDWVNQFNDEKYVDRFFGTKWDRLLKPDAYPTRFLDGGDDSIWKKHHPGDFPKVLGQGQAKPNGPYYASLYNSPFGNDLVFELARRAVVSQKLGSDEHPDLLTVCLSSNDVVGHTFGPDSDEVMDCSVRTDRQLAEFLDWLDAKVGLDHCIVALSSDHGVGPITEFAHDCGHGGERLKSKKIIKKVEQELVEEFGKPADGKRYVKNIMFPWLHLNERVVKAQGLALETVASAARDAVSKCDGVDQAIDFMTIESSPWAQLTDLGRQIVHSYYPPRCGHVYIHWKRYWSKGRKVAVHGAAMDYDQHVPVMLMGQGVKAGIFDQRVCPTGIVGTVCRLLGIRPAPGSTGNVFGMVLERH